MRIIINLLVTAVVAFFLTKILSGVHIDGFSTAIVFAIVLGILNLIVSPILKLLGLPLTIITLGLFSLVINAVVILIADYFIDGMHIDGFWWAFIFSIALSLITSLVSGIFSSDD
ncbi:phage holin family protein [Marnyiella aurantia]|uniref:Phage holin family protein n=1 Tax=Marnyiella aurantia TaxID=2758037 RepID=A0A7D7QF42_9FLAO|nr:phage holin family protein [Marnyiella aurantia]MBA5245629.1 phage holin family protein [Marnyiella aurantia]QMS98961.1 phage holin family protein [Marnyiella aurantia]